VCVCVCVLQDVMKWLIVKTWHLWSSRLITWLIATELPSTMSPSCSPPCVGDLPSIMSRDNTIHRLRWSPPCVGELPSTSSRDTTIHRLRWSPPCVGDLPSIMSRDTWSVSRWRHQSIVFTVWRHTISDRQTFVVVDHWNFSPHSVHDRNCSVSPHTFAGCVGSTASGSWVHSPQSTRLSASS